MKILTFNEFKNLNNTGRNINENKEYKNVELYEDYDVYFQVPFSLFYDESVIGDDGEYKLYLGSKFVYDNITDAEIINSLNELKNGSKETIDLSIPWEKQTYHSQLGKDIHIDRIAQLILNIENNIPLVPISLWIDESSYSHDCYNFIEDGNHRIRALQYLKYTHFPAYIYGSHEKQFIKKLKEVENS